MLDSSVFRVASSALAPCKWKPAEVKKHHSYTLDFFPVPNFPFLLSLWELVSVQFPWYLKNWLKYRYIYDYILRRTCTHRKRRCPTRDQKPILCALLRSMYKSWRVQTRSFAAALNIRNPWKCHIGRYCSFIQTLRNCLPRPEE